MLISFILSLTVLPAVALPGSYHSDGIFDGFQSDPAHSNWKLSQDGDTRRLESSAGSGGDMRGVLVSVTLLEPTVWRCLRLHYRVTASASLQMALRSEGLSFEQPLWSSHRTPSSSPSDTWSHVSVDIPKAAQPYRVVLEGLAGGGGGANSVSVADIQLTDGYCIECDFEEEHLCGYSNQPNGTVKWSVGGRLSQASDNTSGHHMFADSAQARTLQEVSQLLSPLTTEPLLGCLSFLYQLQQAEGQWFSLHARDRQGQYQGLWRAPEPSQHLQEWVPVKVDLKAPYPVQLVFEVAYNSATVGRVLLDDISFSPEFCNAATEPLFDTSVASCDFESGFCRYRQTGPSAPMWKRVAMAPNPYQAGDHTTGSGSFLLTAPNVADRSSSYVSRLVGPVLPGPRRFCLRFFSSLRGGLGSAAPPLAVYLQHVSSGGLREVWHQTQSTRDVWIKHEVTVNTKHSAQHVLFVSACKSFWNCTSVALDDISLTLGDCAPPAGCPDSLLCDFEAGLCDYSQDQDDSADWLRTRGPTPTAFTGPIGDHTSGRGHYLHIEASNMLSGQQARLVSGPLRGSRGQQCLRFFYCLYGTGTGDLRVLLRKRNTALTTGLGLSGKDADVVLWQRSGEQGISWLRATVNYQCGEQHQIVFEASRGSSVLSDTAIDDITFERGPCSGGSRAGLPYVP
ncbi:MAM domain-containing protein 2-like [Engraulis encrasicolus]|uniref:MAM domain-containing protein 2-like n=1 Tax=Engraulis encrasicolus TaxID=184585 RepID=UPI002FD713C5